MSSGDAIARRFYDAFKVKDGATMAAIYTPEARFSDPVFPDLRGDRVGAMWRMLCERGKDLEVSYQIVEATDDRAVVDWEAWYTFSGTGRKVHNVIRATLELESGMVSRHTDEFDLWRWSRQALGPLGLFLGWSPIVRNKIRRTAAAGLEKYAGRG